MSQITLNFFTGYRIQLLIKNKNLRNLTDKIITDAVEVLGTLIKGIGSSNRTIYP